MEMRSCSVRVKKLIKVGLSEGEDVRLDFTLKGGEGAYHDCYCEKSVTMHVLNLLQDLFVSCLKVFVGVGKKYKPLVRTENSYSVIVIGEVVYHVFVVLGGACFDGIGRELPE